jgi:Lon-like ATP-dependent protease
VTGIVEEEEQGSSTKKIRRKSMARSSVENVLTVLRRQLGIDFRNYDIHVNFPGGVPLDGPSAGVTIATAVVSAIRKQCVDNYLAMTGELSIRGAVKPVGGIVAKIEAAHQAGCRRVFIPKENWQERFRDYAEAFQVIPVENLSEVLKAAFLPEIGKDNLEIQPPLEEVLARLEIKPVPSVNLPERGQTC